MSLLTVVQSACRRLALPVPTAVVSSTDAQVLQLWELANQEGTELSERYDWSILVRQTSFATVAAEDQPASVPSDFGHYVIDSMWNRTTKRKCFGPLTSADWQQVLSYPIYTSINPVFRMIQPGGTIDGYVKLIPTPPAGQSIYYEYAIKNWAATTGGSSPTLSSYEADTDFSVVDEKLVAKGLLWRFKAAKGFDYGQDFANYEADVARAQAQDGGGKPKLNLVGGLGVQDIWPANIPIGNWPS
jgi:hypothetical protein